MYVYIYLYVYTHIAHTKKDQKKSELYFSVAMFLEKILKYKPFFSDKLKDLFDKLQQQKPLEMKWGFFQNFSILQFLLNSLIPFLGRITYFKKILFQFWSLEPFLWFGRQVKFVVIFFEFNVI